MVSKTERFSQASSAFDRAGHARSARRQQIDKMVGQPEVSSGTELPVELISQNPDNPRDHMRDLDDLAQSVREVGVVNAITVATVDAYLRERPTQADRLDPGTTHIVVDGHRRLEASRRAGKTTIKATVDDRYVSTDEALLEAAFISNYHNDGMTELEEASALEKLVKFYGNQSKAAKRLGMAQSTISTKLSYLKLSGELQADLAAGRRPAEQVRNLGKLPPEEQRARADERAAEARRLASATAEARTTPFKAQPQPEYHAVIIDSAEEQPGQRKQQVSPEPPASQAPPRNGTEVPEPRPAPAAASPEEAESDRPTWSLPNVTWEELADRLVEDWPAEDRHRLTTKLLRVMTAERSKANS
ncbi:ParB/RepB/Spo0J family partition protein [Streptomyces sp. NPDC087866]|uniref:ParB/RepB/Spo0J family partition protein n=1 Tax=Streptomyces sp. NPDC087866 TaxID=3365815 RepID=UPI0038287437